MNDTKDYNEPDKKKRKANEEDLLGSSYSNKTSIGIKSFSNDIVIRFASYPNHFLSWQFVMIRINFLTVSDPIMTQSHDKILWRGIFYCKFEHTSIMVSFSIFHIIDLSYWWRRSTMMRLLDTGVHCTIESAVESSISEVSAAPSTMVFHVIAIDWKLVSSYHDFRSW